MISKFDKENVGRILAGDYDHFTALLLRLIAKSDSHNRRKLHIVYPDVVEAYENWFYKEHNDVEGVYVPKSWEGK